MLCSKRKAKRRFPSPMTVKEFAPAKINLSLHVTGQLLNGYHLLDSLVVFAEIGDRLTLSSATETGLTVTGPRAKGVPVDGRNLVLKAAALYPGLRADIRLDKHLPAASGIGGGSSDAAATLRGLARLGNLGLPTDAAVLSLGADVPVCLAGQPCRMQGIGDELTALPALPDGYLVLVNPLVEVATADVFKALPRKDNSAMPAVVPAFARFEDFIDFLAEQRNDLQAPAIVQQPVISDVLQALMDTEGCALARMSGSGATCFGLYPTQKAAQQAQQVIAGLHPHWWASSGPMRRV